eukprot:3321539-Rhodomonas_salina.2
MGRLVLNCASRYRDGRLVPDITCDEELGASVVLRWVELYQTPYCHGESCTRHSTEMGRVVPGVCDCRQASVLPRGYHLLQGHLTLYSLCSALCALSTLDMCGQREGGREGGGEAASQA